jgi:hypothetical protein
MNEEITYSIEGTDSEVGHVKADAFLDRISHLLNALNGIDRVVGKSGAPKLYYRIVAAKHSSPLALTFEPVLKKPSLEPSDQRGGYIRRCHDRFFGELESIRTNGQVSDEIDTTLLEHLYELVEGVGREYKNASISNRTEAIDIDVAFEANLKRLVQEDESAYGTLEGKLEAVNIHAGSRRFWIYPSIGLPQRIRCEFLPGTQAQVKEALGNYVRVEGLKHYRLGESFPFKISVREFDVVPTDEAISFNQLSGIAPDATGGLSAVDFVRKIRDEWE